MGRVPGGSQGLISLGVGLAAAGVGAALGLAAERAAVGRELRPSAGSQAGEAFGSLHAPPVAVEADDGTLLHAEVDELPEDVTDSGAADSGAADSGVTDSGAADSGVTDSGAADSGVTDSGAVHADSPGGPDAARTGRPTIVFSHGYALSLDSWHFQRKALRGRYRLVFWDQRGHGRSATGPHGSATIDQIGRDLRRVLDAVASEGPLVLVGHSMGGMTIMSLAHQDPALFDECVLGVAFVSTSAGGLGAVDFGLPRLGPIVQRLAPTAVKALT